MLLEPTQRTPGRERPVLAPISTNVVGITPANTKTDWKPGFECKDEEEAVIPTQIKDLTQWILQSPDRNAPREENRQPRTKNNYQVPKLNFCKKGLGQLFN